MTDGVTHNTLPGGAQGHGHAWGRADNALQTVLDFLLPGSNFEQAVRDALSAGALDPRDIDLDAWSSLIEQMPAGHQRQLADSADMLPATLREAMEALGLSRQTGPGGDATAAAAVRAEDGYAPPGQASALRGDATPAWGRADAPAPPPSQSPPSTLSAMQTAAGAPAAAASTTPDSVAPPPGARIADAPGLVRTEAPATVPVGDRLQPTTLSQPMSPPPVVPSAQGRADALPTQALPLAAGATVMANPQGNVMAPNTVAPPRGPGEAQPAAARDGQLAPAGHTAATGQQRNARKGAAPPGERRADPLLALLTGRRKRADDDDAGATSFQWVFWILTVIAYGALGIAVVAMVPNGGGLTDGLGRPTTGAYALAVGAVAALASWLAARRLSRR